MASAITHFIVGAALALLPAIESRTLRGILPRWAIPVSCGLLAVAPDLDTFAMRAFRDSVWEFLQPSRVLPLAVLSDLAGGGPGGNGGGAAPVARGGMAGLVVGGCAVTHPLLDPLTDGGSGVMLLFPFSAERWFFPWRPIHVSLLGILRFFSRAGYILRSECLCALRPYWPAQYDLPFAGGRALLE